MKEKQVEILPCPFCGANPCRIAEKGRSSMPKPVKR